MTTRFETQSDLSREENAIKILCERSNAKYEKLGENDVDFKITKDKKIIGIISENDVLKAYEKITNEIRIIEKN